MNNDKKVYAIRNLGFCYDDEYYSPLLTSNDHAGHICALFEDKQAALHEWKRLEYVFSHECDFVNVYECDGFDCDPEQIDFELDNVFFDRLKYMSQNELFETIHKLNRHVYFLYEYPADLKIKILWDIKQHIYNAYDITTDWDIQSNKFLKIYFDNAESIYIRGTLKELTDAPLLLTQLIEQDPNLNYDSKSQLLRISPNEQSLNSVNALLKNPLYEIRYLTIQEIYEIEQTLNQTR